MKKSMSNKENSFTLAETLITLIIIGVIAALTIPNIISKYRNAALETAFKKSYAEANHVISKITNEYGSDLYKTHLYDGANHPNGTLFSNLYSSNLKLAPYSKMGAGATDRHNKKVTYKTFSGKTNLTGTLLDDGGAALADGRTIFYEGGFSSSTGAGYKAVFIISYDINGSGTGPNRYGYDLFSFVLSSNGKVYPAGTPEIEMDKDLTYTRCQNPGTCDYENSSNCNGFACAYKAATDPNYFKNLK